MSARNVLTDMVEHLNAEAGSSPYGVAGLPELLDAYRAEVIAERDAQIIAWLEKKAREEGRSNKERRTRGDAIARMADKLSRGAVRPPLSTGPDAIEYAVAFTEDDLDAVQVHTPTESRTEAEARVSRYLDMYPTAHLVQRTVHHSGWTDTDTP
ncbi:hypothetical protein [Streptomyces sp. NPDC047939]|uniref:hypothetical protein n=1 Tax=Streptomyces sp. NPDC047939 TaxID=3155381 RepID=UPI003429177E